MASEANVTHPMTRKKSRLTPPRPRTPSRAKAAGSAGRTRQHGGAGSSAATTPLTIVGVGASAGGLEAFTQLLGALESDAGVTLVLVQHLSPHHESALVSLLAPHTAMQVVEATEGVRLRRDHVYVIPPNTQIAVDGNRLRLADR